MKREVCLIQLSYQKPVVNDELAGVPIVLIASPNSDSVRVYERENNQFEGSVEKIVEVTARDEWTISEEALFNRETGESLPRIPDAFVSFWFAWFSFHPDTLVYQQSLDVEPGARLITTWGEMKR